MVHTKSRQEKALVQALEANRVAYFLPLVSRTRYYRRRKTTVSMPLFPGYVFLRGEIEDTYFADRTKRAANVIRVADQEKINRELWNIFLALMQQAPLDPYPYLRKGVRVEVRSGPFTGIQGIIEERAKHDRLILQVDTLGQATSLEIDGALLEPIE